MTQTLWTVEAQVGENWLTLAIEMSRADARETKRTWARARQYKRTRIVKFTREAK